VQLQTKAKNTDKKGHENSDKTIDRWAGKLRSVSANFEGWNVSVKCIKLAQDDSKGAQDVPAGKRKRKLLNKLTYQAKNGASVGRCKSGYSLTLTTHNHTIQAASLAVWLFKYFMRFYGKYMATLSSAPYHIILIREPRVALSLKINSTASTWAPPTQAQITHKYHIIPFLHTNEMAGRNAFKN